MRQSFETAFQCRVIQWAEPTSEDTVQFTAIDRRGRVVVADSVELLALELADPVPVYALAA